MYNILWQNTENSRGKKVITIQYILRLPKLLVHVESDHYGKTFTIMGIWVNYIDRLFTSIVVNINFRKQTQ